MNDTMKRQVSEKIQDALGLLSDPENTGVEQAMDILTEALKLLDN